MSQNPSKLSENIKKQLFKRDRSNSEERDWGEARDLLASLIVI